jgi:two-component system, cell cycle sensor histidine kinase and response regulator CckA
MPYYRTEPMAEKAILLVDDEAPVLTLLAGFLRQCGYRVIAAAGPNEALSAFRSERSDIALVVCDVNMPGMSGPELVDRLARADPALRVLFISGYSDDEACDRIAANGNALLLKPFTMDTLASKVRTLLEEPRSASGLSPIQ